MKDLSSLSLFINDLQEFCLRLDKVSSPVCFKASGYDISGIIIRSALFWIDSIRSDWLFVNDDHAGEAYSIRDLIKVKYIITRSPVFSPALFIWRKA